MPRSMPAPAASPSPVAGRGFAHDTERPDVHTSSEDYARRFTGGGQLALVRQADGVERALRTIPAGPLRVLDVGGGHAQVAGMFAARGATVIVHGSAARCLDRLRPLTRTHPARVAGCVSPLLELPFADGAFDLVVGLRLLAHVSRWQALLAEMHRVTRRFLLVDFPLYGGVQRFAGAFFRLKKRVEGNTRPFFLYRRRDVADYLATLGARPVLAMGEMVLPIALHRLVHAPGASLAMEHALAGLGLGNRLGSPVLLLADRAPGSFDVAPVRRGMHGGGS